MWTEISEVSSLLDKETNTRKICKPVLEEIFAKFKKVFKEQKKVERNHKILRVAKSLNRQDMTPFLMESC